MDVVNKPTNQTSELHERNFGLGKVNLPDVFPGQDYSVATP